MDLQTLPNPVSASIATAERAALATLPPAIRDAIATKRPCPDPACSACKGTGMIPKPGSWHQEFCACSYPPVSAARKRFDAAARAGTTTLIPDWYLARCEHEAFRSYPVPSRHNVAMDLNKPRVALEQLAVDVIRLRQDGRQPVARSDIRDLAATCAKIRLALDIITEQLGAMDDAEARYDGAEL